MYIRCDINLSGIAPIRSSIYPLFWSSRFGAVVGDERFERVDRRFQRGSTVRRQVALRTLRRSLLERRSTRGGGRGMRVVFRSVVAGGRGETRYRRERGRGAVNWARCGWWRARAAESLCGARGTSGARPPAASPCAGAACARAAARPRRTRAGRAALLCEQHETILANNTLTVSFFSLTTATFLT